MTHEEKINYMRIAAGICCLGFTNDQLDKLVSLYELVIKKEGKSSLEDAIRIEEEVKERAIAREVKCREDKAKREAELTAKP
jgi:hypothetical protein